MVQFGLENEIIFTNLLSLRFIVVDHYKISNVNEGHCKDWYYIPL